MAGYRPVRADTEKWGWVPALSTQLYRAAAKDAIGSLPSERKQTSVGHPGMIAMPRTEGYALRSDVSLRTVFPHLETRIFETVPGRYQIVFDREVLEATKVAERFAHSIRFIGAMV